MDNKVIPCGNACQINCSDAAAFPASMAARLVPNFETQYCVLKDSDECATETDDGEASHNQFHFF